MIATTHRGTALPSEPAPEPAGSGGAATVPGGLVVARPPSGPVFAGRRTVLRRPAPDTFVPLLSPGGRFLVALLTLGWLACFVVFWHWWLRPEHRTSWAALGLNTALLLYVAWQPSVFLLAANRLRQVNRRLPVPPLSVAFVVTKAPSEPWPVARATLTAMLRQNFRYPYHVWLCDEDPSAETLAWCAQHGVLVSTRRGETAYHRDVWPRRTRCKEGNLAWFYDHWGYANYDVVAQLDCDHKPSAGYLTEMVRPFADPAVGYVAAPSVCDSNATTSWSARGRLHREAAFHGPYQLGHHLGLAPVCIGSHYAVRTAALAQIGGVGPELAEDFSTSFLLTSAGWQGAFAHRAAAHGDGPLTFAAMVTQEFQWCRSLVAVLLGLAPRHLRRMPWGLRLRFLYALTYYPLLAVATVCGLLLPAAAAVTGYTWVRVSYLEFLLGWSTLEVWVIGVTMVLRHRNLLRPAYAPLLSWETWLYIFTRWIWIAWGVVAAVRQIVSSRPVGFRVTPKARDGLEPIPARTVVPYVVIAAAMAGAALYGRWLPAQGRPAAGYLLLCVLASLNYAVVAVAVPLLHAAEAARQTGAGRAATIRATAAGPLLAALLGCLPMLAAVASCADQLPAVLPSLRGVL